VTRDFRIAGHLQNSTDNGRTPRNHSEGTSGNSQCSQRSNQRKRDASEIDAINMSLTVSNSGIQHGQAEPESLPSEPVERPPSSASSSARPQELEDYAKYYGAFANDDWNSQPAHTPSAAAEKSSTAIPEPRSTAPALKSVPDELAAALARPRETPGTSIEPSRPQAAQATSTEPGSSSSQPRSRTSSFGAGFRSASKEALASIRTKGSRLLRPRSTTSLRGSKPDTTDAPPVPKLPSAFSQSGPGTVHVVSATSPAGRSTGGSR
jgi:hypothetical protein